MCICVCVCWDETTAAKGQVTTCEKTSSKQRKTIVKSTACALQCERRICHLTSDRTEIFITEVTANPYVCAASVSISLCWASPASFCLCLWVEVVSGGGEMWGKKILAHFVCQFVPALRQPECLQMSPQHCSINTISSPTTRLKLMRYPNQWQEVLVSACVAMKSSYFFLYLVFRNKCLTHF